MQNPTIPQPNPTVHISPHLAPILARHPTQQVFLALPQPNHAQPQNFRSTLVIPVQQIEAQRLGISCRNYGISKVLYGSAVFTIVNGLGRGAEGFNKPFCSE
jgi:hypothetical protein